MIDCICSACVWVRRLGLVHTAEQDGTTPNVHVHYSTVGEQCNERTCAAAMQHKDFQAKDLRSQCNMGDDASVELATEEATS